MLTGKKPGREFSLGASYTEMSQWERSLGGGRGNRAYIQLDDAQLETHFL